MMQDEVNKIVSNALADGREIWFPGVGSLVPEFRSAWRASARQLERPSRRIAFLLSEKTRRSFVKGRRAKCPKLNSARCLLFCPGNLRYPLAF